MLVKCSQLSQVEGVQLVFEEQDETGPVSLEVREKFFVGLSQGEGVCLGEHVGHKRVEAVVVLELYFSSLGLAVSDELNGRDSSLVEGLEERVLGIGSWLAEYELCHELLFGKKLFLHLGVLLPNALHFHLLDVSGEPGQSFGVGDDCLDDKSLSVVVEGIDEGQQNWEVFAYIFLVEEDCVHFVHSAQKLLKHFESVPD